MRSSASLCRRPCRRCARARTGRSFAAPAARATPSSAGCPLDWSETKNVVWKSKVPGLGWSSPVVGGGRVWLTSATGDRDVSLRALAFDVETGREVVNVEVFRLRRPRDINPKNSYASPTPIIDGDRVYVHFGADGTAALTTTGEIVWKTTLPYASQHGAGGSPIVYGDLLIFSCDGHDAAFVDRPRQAHGQGALEDQPPPAVRPGVYDAAGDSRRRAAIRSSAWALIARRPTIRRRARRSGASSTPTDSRTCRGRCSATAWSTSRPDFSSHR